MSLRDKIISIFNKHGSLSSEELKEILEKEHKITRSKRTIQRHIQEKIDEGILIPNRPLGREQTYSLRSNKVEKTEISNYLIKRFWREEEEIEKEYLYGDPLQTYRKARLLWLKLPSPFKEKLSSTFEQVNAELKKAKRIDNYITMMNQAKYLKKSGIPLIIHDMARILHEMEGVES